MPRKGKSPPPGLPRGQRPLATRLRSARGRTVSSKRWLERQLNDPYVAAARASGYRSRAAYKLAEIDAKHKLLKPGMRVLDLGAAPGGWSQVAAAKVKAGEAGGGQVLAVDIHAMEPLPGVMLLQLDFLAQESEEEIEAALGGKADAVLSDMAAPATGHKATDHLRVIALCEAALAFAVTILAEGGSFLCKVLQGGTEGELLATMKRHFRTVRHVKPPASRSDSSELYVLATGFRA
jgi:23S rRNA (uridine2552-2'-O)-methyltransferase